ncbi:nicotinate (nicotinamide) nucleotide adenylyltransferase [Mariprofundus sp. NF]|uniref:nicotinate (nicotinamide) nucleotide adenylyltransferase n=1 Tax=Mariprofundus sp. NF TaxID=2608716 RepID=UPI0015A1D0AC|nr:nicotinate (nicotinamide) nucleotide adenylyltransferase [Mariprofundus sp. NF]NWF39027.1 nicotinate (nicotinamide) nucleotide adenylyltransferase [Mariprofundus sp. NF]
MELDRRHIGLFGGTFDPPHNGHVALVEAGLKVMGLDEILVIPAEPVHRSLSGRADGVKRLSWLQAVFAANAAVTVVDWEVVRGRPVAAIETLREFRDANPETVPWLMLGADAWAGLQSWREYPAHLQLCNVAVFARQGMDAEMSEHEGWQQVNLCSWRECETPGHCCYLQVELPDISATALRRDAEMGHSLAGRVPEQVISRIEKSYQIVD